MKQIIDHPADVYRIVTDERERSRQSARPTFELPVHESHNVLGVSDAQLDARPASESIVRAS
jgi:hypothetical protein